MSRQAMRAGNLRRPRQRPLAGHPLPPPAVPPARSPERGWSADTPVGCARPGSSRNSSGRAHSTRRRREPESRRPAPHPQTTARELTYIARAGRNHAVAQTVAFTFTSSRVRPPPTRHLDAPAVTPGAKFTPRRLGRTAPNQSRNTQGASGSSWRTASPTRLGFDRACPPVSDRRAALRRTEPRHRAPAPHPRTTGNEYWEPHECLGGKCLRQHESGARDARSRPAFVSARVEAAWLS